MEVKSLSFLSLLTLIAGPLYGRMGGKEGKRKKGKGRKEGREKRGEGGVYKS